MPPNYRSNGHLDVTHTGNLRTNVCAELQQKPSDRCGADVDGEKEAIAKINRAAVEVEPESLSKQQEERKKEKKTAGSNGCTR